MTAKRDESPNPPVPPILVDVGPIPKSKEEFAQILLEGATRAIKCAMNSKEMTDAVKAGDGLYKTLYGSDGDDDTGSAFGSKGGRTNGLHGTLTS